MTFHETPVITTIVVGLGLAFLFGAIAHRFRMPLVAGYLLAGVVVGPFTPGYVADQAVAAELAEIGVILLMFGVGLHFSVKDLWSVRNTAVPGALIQVTIGTAVGFGLARLMGWSTGAGVVFGLALSVASTVVLMRALGERRLMATERGRLAVGWLIVQDLIMVLTLVLLPVVAPIFAGGTSLDASTILAPLGLTLLKLGAFFAVMLVAGRRLIPWLLHHVVLTGSRELFRLAVLSIALGVAYGAAKLFGVSFALGAVFAGIILSESTLSQQAANESLPMRDAFAVLFFVSAGMLFDPTILVRETGPVLATLLVILFVNSLIAAAIARGFGLGSRTAFTLAASLSQIGEFSFILAGLGLGLGLISTEARDLILAGAILSILVNPLFFLALDKYEARRGWTDETATGARSPTLAQAAPHPNASRATASTPSEPERPPT